MDGEIKPFKDRLLFDDIAENDMQEDGIIPCREEDTLAAFILDMLDHMKAAGYTIYPETSESIFTAAGNLSPGTVRDIYGMLPLFKSLICKGRDEYASFENDFRAFIKKKDGVYVLDDSDLEAASYFKTGRSISENLDKVKRTEKSYVQEIERHRKDEKEALPPLAWFSASHHRSYDSFVKEYGAQGKLFKKIYRNSPGWGILSHIREYAEGKLPLPSLQELADAKKELGKGLRKAVKEPGAEKFFAFTGCCGDILDALKKDLERKDRTSLGQAEKALQETSRQKELLEKQKTDFEKAMARYAKTLEKSAPSFIHREDFFGKNAVRSSFEGELSFMERSFNALAPDEKKLLRDYISDNAIKFRTRLSRNIRTGSRKRLDIPETCKKAMRSGGIPLSLSFRKKKRSRTSVVMFLDVSGSCKAASAMMLTFMHSLMGVFSSCHVYAFTNQLYDISRQYRESRDADIFTELVLGSIPRAGAYSDYYRPLECFCKEHMPEVTGESIVLFMGDARNNKNPSGEYYMKRIARKAKRAYWLCTDPRDKWDQGDSIIGTYAPYMDAVFETVTPGDIAYFLERMR